MPVKFLSVFNAVLVGWAIVESGMSRTRGNFANCMVASVGKVDNPSGVAHADTPNRPDSGIIAVIAVHKAIYMLAPSGNCCDPAIYKKRGGWGQIE
jgi:hypothetical protein